MLQRPHYEAILEDTASGHRANRHPNTGHAKFITQFPGCLCPTVKSLEHILDFINAEQIYANDFLDRHDAES